MEGQAAPSLPKKPKIDMTLSPCRHELLTPPTSPIDIPQDDQDLTKSGIWDIKAGKVISNFDLIRAEEKAAGVWGGTADWRNGATWEQSFGEDMYVDQDVLQVPTLPEALNGYTLETQLKLCTAYATYLRVIIKAMAL